MNEIGTKEFIHSVHCVNRTFRLVASKEADLEHVYSLPTSLASPDYVPTASWLRSVAA